MRRAASRSYWFDRRIRLHGLGPRQVRILPGLQESNKPTNKYVLFSALGVYNGKVYEALWERAKAEPLNRTEVPAAYEVRKYKAFLLLPPDSFSSSSPRHLSSLFLSGGSDWQLRQNYDMCRSIQANNFTCINYCKIL